MIVSLHSYCHAMLIAEVSSFLMWCSLRSQILRVVTGCAIQSGLQCYLSCNMNCSALLLALHGFLPCNVNCFALSKCRLMAVASPKVLALQCGLLATVLVLQCYMPCCFLNCWSPVLQCDLIAIVTCPAMLCAMLLHELLISCLAMTLAFQCQFPSDR